MRSKFLIVCSTESIVRCRGSVSGSDIAPDKDNISFYFFCCRTTQVKKITLAGDKINKLNNKKEKKPPSRPNAGKEIHLAIDISESIKINIKRIKKTPIEGGWPLSWLRSPLCGCGLSTYA